MQWTTVTTPGCNPANRTQSVLLLGEATQCLHQAEGDAQLVAAARAAKAQKAVLKVATAKQPLEFGEDEVGQRRAVTLGELDERGQVLADDAAQVALRGVAQRSLRR